MAKEIRALTGVRGLAACGVVVYHVHTLHNAYSGAPYSFLNELLYDGYLAVDLFFILSGFVMAMSYAQFWREGWTKNHYFAFLMRRIARIYPLYALMVMVVAVPILLGLSHAMPLTLPLLAQNLLLIQAWGLSESLNPSSWSISTEWAAYLLFPLLTIAVFKTHWKFCLGICIAAVVALAAMQGVTTPAQVDSRDGPMDIFWMPSMLPLLRCLCEFMLGLATYRLSRNPAAIRLLSQPLNAYLIAAITFTSLFLTDADILVVLCIPAFLLVLTVGDNLVTRFMGSRVVFFLGEISYSLYMLHPQFLRIRRIVDAKLAPRLGEGPADAVALCLLYGGLIICSYAAYRLVEKPCRNYLRRVEQKWLARQEKAGNPQAADQQAIAT